MRWLVWGIIALLLVSSASAYNIADYPTMFFKDKTFTATIIKSQAGSSAERTAANLLMNDLQRTAQRYGLKPNAIRTSTAGGQADEILIGTPCGNLRIRELLGIGPSKCRTALKNGLLKVVQDEHTYLIITGPDGESVLDATKILIDPRHKNQLGIQSANVVRKPYQKHYVIGGRRFLDIGQTIGAETPTLYTGHPYVTYRPLYEPYESAPYPGYYPEDCAEYSGTTYGAVVVKTKPGCPGQYTTGYYGGVPTRDVNILGQRTSIRFPTTSGV